MTWMTSRVMSETRPRVMDDTDRNYYKSLNATSQPHTRASLVESSPALLQTARTESRPYMHPTV